MTDFEFDLINTESGMSGARTAPAEPAVTDLHSREGSVQMRRLTGGASDGVDIVRVDNGRLTLELMPTRGLGIWRGDVDGVRLGWESPVERPVHPAFVDPMRRGGIGWLDGFNEFLCRCGLGWHGAPGTDIHRGADGSVVSEQFLPLHGRIANLPAHRVTASSRGNRLTIRGEVDEGCLFGGRLRLNSELSTDRDSAAFDITDTVTNRAGSPAEVEMLYHCNIGRPFLEDGATFCGAVAEVAPRDPRAAESIADWIRFGPPEVGFAEQAYFARPVPDGDGRALAVLANANRDRAIAVRFDLQTLPWFVLWKNTQAEADGYVTGLEPASSFPHLRSFERDHGRVISLEPGQSVQFRLRVEVGATASEARRLIDEAEERQAANPAVVAPQPRPDWSPVPPGQ